MIFVRGKAMAISAESILKDMLDAARGVFGRKWKKVAPIAKEQFRLLAAILVKIEADWMSGKIGEDEAKELFEMHKLAVKGTIAAIEGIMTAIAEAAINAALEAIRKAVNSALGWEII